MGDLMDEGGISLQQQWLMKMKVGLYAKGGWLVLVLMCVRVVDETRKRRLKKEGREGKAKSLAPTPTLTHSHASAHTHTLRTANVQQQLEK